jgi:dTDP-4-amino-4,6-dideoxygalactose transaminase
LLPADNQPEFNSRKKAQNTQNGRRYKASPGEIRSVVVNEFHGVKVVGGEVAEDLFNRGLCLPSGTAMTEGDLDRVIDTIMNSRPGQIGYAVSVN